MATSLQEYLKRYASDAELPRKKKKKPKVLKPAHAAITVIDADPVWQNEVKEISSESEEDQDNAPLVIKDVEVRRMQRLEELKMNRPYISTADDGSGWVAVSTVSGQGNLSPQDTHQGDRESSSPSRRHGSSEERPEGLLPRNNVQHSDLSPPRRNTKRSPRKDIDEPDLSPPRNKVGHSDLSPPRKSTIMSPRRDIDEPDLSPPRNKVGHLDLLPPRKSTRKRSPGRGIDELDLSPPRKRSSAPKANLSSLSPPRRSFPADLSPPSKSHASSRISSATRAGTPDISPPRKRSTTSRLSPPRRKIEAQKAAVIHDLSPPRKSVTLDLSPPRRRHIATESGARNLEGKREAMADGTTAGLRTGRQLAKEMTVKKEEDSRRFKEMDASITGRNANTVYRDKHGKRLESLDELLKLQQVEKAPKEDKPLEWGKGLVQRRKLQETLAEIEAEKAKPFARTRDDPELDKQLKEEVRWGDPMAHLIKKKQSAGESALVDLGASEKMKESGFIVPQTIPNHSWLKRNVTAPPNRYNIRPGRHWDGVDRSTGYERDMYKRQNEKKANEVEAYLWSVADM